MSEEKLYFIQFRSTEPPYDDAVTFGTGRNSEEAKEKFLKRKRTHRFVDYVAVTSASEVHVPEYRICLEKIVSEK